MIRVAIEIDGVLRDTYTKLEQVYQKFLIDELELVDEDFQFEIKKPFTTKNYDNHFMFKTEDEFFTFVYEEFAMEIFGHSPSTELSTFMDLQDLQIEFQNQIEWVFVSEQIGKTKPATLFFISKFGCDVDKVIFFNKKTISKIWNEFDVIVASSPNLLSESETKTTIKYERSYNSDITITDTITNLKDLESTLKKIIQND
jgi:hypothetical protein